ncbi:MAG TPA: hypothetical protein VGF28_19145 [Thermoanaerobaculia bacterium]|jgi:uncharacterized membrane protein YidH (DUF202 family)
MSRIQLVWLHLSVALTTITGVVFAAMKYFMTGDDEFAVVNHPMQPYMLAAHVVVAPVVLFLLGWTFSNHMLPKYRFGDGSNKKTGVAQMALIVPMALSAYLLQVSTNETMREVMAAAHWITSGVFVVAYVVHLLLKPATADDRSDAADA